MRYFIGFLITIGLIILLIVLLLTRGGGKPQAPLTTKALSSYSSTSAQVSMTIDGPVNAQSQHEQVRITVDADNVIFDHIKGYNNEVVKTVSFANSENSYSAFLHSLGHAGFTNGDKSPLLKDEQGYCPTSNRYIFELTQDGKNLERYWATDCGKPMTFLGDQSLTIELFQAQVPDYSVLTEDIDL